MVLKGVLIHFSFLPLRSAHVLTVLLRIGYFAHKYLGNRGANWNRGPNFLKMHRILTSLAPLESPEPPLPNGAKLVRLRYILRKLRPKGYGHIFDPKNVVKLFEL